MAGGLYSLCSCRNVRSSGENGLAVPDLHDDPPLEVRLRRFLEHPMFGKRQHKVPNDMGREVQELWEKEKNHKNTNEPGARK